jgi:hypothetical protein
MFRGRYRSQQGFDREQEMVTVDPVGTARLADLGVWLESRRARSSSTATTPTTAPATSRASKQPTAQRRHTIELGAFF